MAEIGARTVVLASLAAGAALVFVLHEAREQSKDQPGPSPSAPVQPQTESPKPLTPERKIEIVQHAFGALHALIQLSVAHHDMVIGKVKLDMQAGEIKRAREFAHSLVESTQKRQADAAQLVDELRADTELDGALIDQVDEVANELFGDLVGSAAGIAATADFGMGENGDDVKLAAQHSKQLTGLMLKVYAVHGVTKPELDMTTWRLAENRPRKSQ